jgi:hypothetical protein
LLETVF